MEGAGIIGPDQAEAIRAFEHAAAPPAPLTPAVASTRRIPVVAEALGYLGGLLGVIGLVLLVTRYWPDMGAPARMALALGGVAVLTLAGIAVPHRDEMALDRLRWFVWLGATACAGLAGGVFVADLLDSDDGTTIVLGGATLVLLHSAALWWQRERPVQQATCLVAALVSTGTLAARLLDVGRAGLVVWAVAGMMLVAGIRHLTTYSPLTVFVGAAGAAIGAGMTMDGDRGAGLLFLTLTTLCLMALAAAARPVPTAADRVALTVAAVMAATQALPQTIVWFAAEAGIATGLVVAIGGAVLVAIADRPWVYTPLLLQLAGGAALVGGTAVTGTQSVAFATVAGLTVAVTLIAMGTMPHRAVMTVFGCLGLLVNVPWAISHRFPGEGRAPLLIAVSGVLIVLVAVWLSHQSGELRHQFRHHAH
ncbi:MAG: hypothetical protein RL238_870 [Actinomycetota bacterium]